MEITSTPNLADFSGAFSDLPAAAMRGVSLAVYPWDRRMRKGELAP
jgi:hypothetical protein